MTNGARPAGGAPAGAPPRVGAPAGRPPAGPSRAPSGPPGQRRLIVLGAAVVLVVAVAIGAATAFGGPGRQVETGIVVAVHATSLSSVQGFSIRTADGRTVDFRVGTIENASAFALGHLSEHKVSLAPVRVTYVASDGGNVAVRIEDAP